MFSKSMLVARLVRGENRGTDEANGQPLYTSLSLDGFGIPMDSFAAAAPFRSGSAITARIDMKRART